MADDPLTEAINTSIAEQGLTDSVVTPTTAEDEEQPEEPEQEVEDELPEDEDADEADEFDEEDFEEIEDDEDDAPEEDDEADEAEESDEDEDDELYTVKVRGEELEVTLDELRDGYSREEDYTRDKQELREREREVQQVYEQMREWYEDRASDPARWINEIVTEEADTPPDVTLAQAIARTENPTGLFARTFKVMAEAGQLDRELVEAFEDQLDLSGRAENAETEDRITRLERELQEERERRQQEQQQRQRSTQQQKIVQQYEQQWSNIVDQEGLEFDSVQDEFDVKRELVEFARDREIVNLEDAWSAMQYRRSQQQQSSESQRKKKRKKKAREAAKRKKKAAAMNRKPTGGESPPKRKKGDTDAAIEEAAKELGIL